MMTSEAFWHAMMASAARPVTGPLLTTTVVATRAT
jgi:hypothetical protein